MSNHVASRRLSTSFGFALTLIAADLIALAGDYFGVISIDREPWSWLVVALPLVALCGASVAPSIFD